MNLFKCSLLLVAFCLNLHGCAASSWRAVIPSSVKGLVGSCVVIPCTFDYPPPKTKVTQFTGFWKDDSQHFIYHPEQQKARQEYHNRTQLLGELQHKNCSLRIDPLQSSDKGPFHFRIEMKGYESYSYRTHAVSITAATEPEPMSFSVKEEVLLGESVSAICSASHTCPSSPPVFTWSHSGPQQVQQQQLEGGLWKTTSTITFQPNHSDHNRSLQCSVSYRGGQHQSMSKLLSVKYAPEIKNSSSCYFEGHQVRCMCMAECNPPCAVNLLLSDKVLTNIKMEKYGLLTIATLQDKVGLFKSVKCMAVNTVGKAELMLSLPHGEMFMYIGIGIAAAALILTALIVGVAVKGCRRSRSASTLHKNNTDIGLDKQNHVAKSRNRKASFDPHSTEHVPNNHIYGNRKNAFDPDDDAVYANC